MSVEPRGEQRNNAHNGFVNPRTTNQETDKKIAYEMDMTTSRQQERNHCDVWLARNSREPAGDEH